MIHHLSLAVADLDRSAVFYDAVFAPLDYQRVWTTGRAVGYGPAGGGDKFAIKLAAGPVEPPKSGFHIAFAADNRAAVDKFHRAAIRNGGSDQGKPGIRAHYGPDYYAAFALDPDGYWLEAVSKNKR